MIVYLDEIVETAKKAEIPITFLNIPDFHQLNPYSFKDLDEDLRKKLLAYKHVTYIETLNFLDQNKLTEYWVSSEDPHPNALGHDSIYRALTSSPSIESLVKSSL